MSLVDFGKRLLEAARVGDTEEVRQLMTHGAPFTTDWLGTSPLHLAAQCGHLETAEVLLRAGISRDARTKVDRTPLHVASQEGHLSVVDLLIRHGADLEAKDMLQMTALHWAVERGHTQIIETLLQRGSDIQSLSKFDKTPIDIAIDNSRDDLVQLLHTEALKTGADIIQTISTKHQPTPKHSNLNPVTMKPLPLILKAGSAKTYSRNEKKKNPQKIAPKPIVISTYSKADNTIVINNVQGNVQEDEDDEEEEETTSTSVLATLAALAEATAPNTSVTSPEAIQWLETQGITMLPSDNSTLVSSALEGGQTISLTEAGKLALNWVKDKGPGKKDQKVITIVADQSQLSNVEGHQEVVLVTQKVKQEINAGKSDSNMKDNDRDELQRELEEVRRQAQVYKSMLVKKEHEAEEYRKQLEQIISGTKDK